MTVLAVERDGDRGGECRDLQDRAVIRRAAVAVIKIDVRLGYGRFAAGEVEVSIEVGREVGGDVGNLIGSSRDAEALPIRFQAAFMIVERALAGAGTDRSIKNLDSSSTGVANQAAAGQHRPGDRHTPAIEQLPIDLARQRRATAVDRLIGGLRASRSGKADATDHGSRGQQCMLHVFHGLSSSLMFEK